ncbi:hypothetical protein NOCA2540090 [metagenome]|uniref:SnoaL-like domain-containing protein n=1 Tax=metagenome TaxID=256318 RepID=A0A2P2CA54_9ZZZZ
MNAQALVLLSAAGLGDLDIEVLAIAGDRVLVQGVDQSDGRTLLGSVRGLRGGRPTHVATYRGPSLAPARSQLAGSHDLAVAEQAARSYFDLLDSGRVDLAAECFSLDATYDVPMGEGSRRLCVGRSEILGWFHERGTSPARHHVEIVAAAGAGRFLVDGWVSGGPAGPASFMSSLRVCVDSLITDYAAVMQVPRVQG